MSEVLNHRPTSPIPVLRVLRPYYGHRVRYHSNNNDHLHPLPPSPDKDKIIKDVSLSSASPNHSDELSELSASSLRYAALLNER